MTDFVVAELERMLANLIRFGSVAELDGVRARVRVRTGGITTGWIPWVTVRAGPNRTWNPPEPGEQVLVLSPCGDLGQAVVLPAIYQNTYQAPGTRNSISRTDYQDGAWFQYDREAHTGQIDIPASGSLTVYIGRTTLVLKDGETTLTTPKLTVDSPQSLLKGDVTVSGRLTYLSGMVGRPGSSGAAATIDGDVRASGSVAAGGDVNAGGISLKSHIHSGVKGGPDVSGPPR